MPLSAVARRKVVVGVLVAALIYVVATAVLR